MRIDGDSMTKTLYSKCMSSKINLSIFLIDDKKSRFSNTTVKPNRILKAKKREKSEKIKAENVCIC